MFITCIQTDRRLVSSVISPAVIFFLLASTDGQESSWEARWQHSKPKCLLKRLSSDDNTKDQHDSSVKTNGLSRQQVWSKFLKM